MKAFPKHGDLVTISRRSLAPRRGGATPLPILTRLHDRDGVISALLAGNSGAGNRCRTPKNSSESSACRSSTAATRLE